MRLMITARACCQGWNPISKRTAPTLICYNDGALIACFAKNIPESVVKEIAKRQPLRAVFRDSSFANSPAKINVTEIFKLLAPDTRVKVL